MRAIISSILVLLVFASLALAFNKERDCKCRINSNKKIIGGREVPSMTYPWQVQMAMKDEYSSVPDILKRLIPDNYKMEKHNCGGVVLNEKWILTAAHCVILPVKYGGVSIDNFRIGYGSSDLVEIYNKNKFASIEEIFVHQDSEIETHTADIALIKLKTPLKFDKTVQPACLPTKHQDKYNDGQLTITGWGSIISLLTNPFTGEGDQPIVSRYLKEGNANDNTDVLEFCDNKLHNICVDDKQTKDSACKGDSGGPLQNTVNGRTTVIGLASHVDFKIEKDYNIRICSGGTAYARISTYLDWIKNHVKDEFCT